MRLVRANNRFQRASVRSCSLHSLVRLSVCAFVFRLSRRSGAHAHTHTQTHTQRAAPGEENQQKHVDDDRNAVAVAVAAPVVYKTDSV